MLLKKRMPEGRKLVWIFKIESSNKVPESPFRLKSTKCFRRSGRVKLSRTLEGKNCINFRVTTPRRVVLYNELRHHNSGFCGVLKPRLASQSSHLRRTHQSTKKLQRQEVKKQIGKLNLSFLSPVEPNPKGKMTNFLENDTAAEYERLRHAIGQPDFDSLPTSPHQPITEEELQQVPQPLRLGDEHQGEANYNAIADKRCTGQEGNDAEKGNREEENKMATGEEEAEGNTEAGSSRPSLQEAVEEGECPSDSGNGSGADAEEGEGVEASPQPSPPNNKEVLNAQNHTSGSFDEFDRLTKGGEAMKREEMEESQRAITAHRSCEEDEKGMPIPSHESEHHRHPQRVFKCEGEEGVAVQVDLDGNLTAATRRALKVQQANKAELGAVQVVDQPVALPRLSGDDEMAVDNVGVSQYPTQCHPSNAAEDILEAPPSSPWERRAKFEVDDFFISSPPKPAKTPSRPTSRPFATHLTSSQQRAELFPSPSPKSLGPPQADSVLPQAPLPHVPRNPAAITKPSTPELLHSQQQSAPNHKGAPKPISGKDLAVQKPMMKGRASKERARKTFDTVAHGITQATGEKPVLVQNGRRVRVVKLPRPASTVCPPRPPRYPTPLPSTVKPTPEPLSVSQGLENIQREKVVKRSHPGSAEGHAELLKLLDTLGNLPPRPANGDEKLRAVASATDGYRADAAVSSAIPTSGDANTTIGGNECPGRDPESQELGAETVAANSMASSPTARKSVKRKLELTAEERQEKKRIRAMRNRQSAEKSRRRRKEYAVSLESNVQKMRGESQEWRGNYYAGLKRLSEMQRDIREMYGDNHQIATPAMQDVVDDVGHMVGRCPYTFRREEPEIELRSIGEDGRRGARGRGSRGGRARRAGRGSRVNRGGRGEHP